MKKVNGFSASMKKIYFGLVVSYFEKKKKNQKKDKYVTSKMEKVMKKKRYCDIFIK